MPSSRLYVCVNVDVVTVLAGGSYVRCFNVVSGTLQWELSVMSALTSHRASLQFIGTSESSLSSFNTTQYNICIDALSRCEGEWYLHRWDLNEPGESIEQRSGLSEFNPDKACDASTHHTM